MAEDKEEKPVKEAKKERFEVVSVTTETAPFIRDNKDDVILEDKSVLALILNRLDKIEKAVA